MHRYYNDSAPPPIQNLFVRKRSTCVRDPTKVQSTFNKDQVQYRSQQLSISWP